ncbi:MAG TPA: hypothetical protein VKM55_08370 [Candidatus Lokiarchaeia archaeon]|nr:hypothetical protein [Candidatus Lokiarchaeia archaeon]
MGTYQGIELFDSEKSVLNTLEQHLQEPLPNIDEVAEFTFGFTAMDGNITGLGLYQKHMTSLPESICGLQSLMWLNLRMNEISVLPVTIGKLKSLVTLDLWGNRLTSLPETIGDLRLLKKLELSLNKVTSIPDTIGDLSSLEVLCTHDNQLSSLPDTIGNLHSLKKLDISTNYWIRTLPESIIGLESLVELIIGGTNIRGRISKTSRKLLKWIQSRGLV